MKRNIIAILFVVAMVVIVFTAVGIEYGVAKAAEYGVVSAISVFVAGMLIYLRNQGKQLKNK